MARSRSGRRWAGRVAGLLMLGLLLASSPAPDGVRTEHVFLVIIAILVGAKLLGEVAERLGQPAVLGELIAGVLLGPSVLAILPVTGSISELIHLFAQIGVAVLLFEIGLETDLKEMFRVGGSATVVAIVGVVAPFLLGFGFWYLVQPDLGVQAPGASDTVVAIFVGATLTATSVGITARVLTDLNRIHTPEARVIIGAAVIDDVLGLVILAIVSGLAAGATLSVLGIALKFVIAGGFLVAAVIIGNVIAPRLFAAVDGMRVRGVLLVSALSFALLFAALAGLAGSAMIIGSFAAGIVLSSTNQFDLITERIAPVADIFTPIFFVAVGAGVNVNLFLPWSSSFDIAVLGVGAALLVIAMAGKVLSGYAVGWGARPLNHLAIGVGMIPRGEVGLIFAHLGLVNGILSPSAYSAILIMVIFTTFLSPPLLKPIFGRVAVPREALPPPLAHLHDSARTGSL
jgi:Kef-type K+ transport system membrane component KefB